MLITELGWNGDRLSQAAAEDEYRYVGSHSDSPWWDAHSGP